MKIKKLLMLTVLGIGLAIPGFPSTDPTVKELSPVAPSSVNDRQQQLLNRLEEIKNLDIKNMSRVEKKKLRREVRSIEKEMHTTYTGVYISVGGIIIILLLLILLL